MKTLKLELLFAFVLAVAVVASVMLAGGCTVPAKALAAMEQIHGAAKRVSSVSEPAFDELCGFAVKVCIAQSDGVCDRLKQCQKARHEVNAAIISVHTAISAATTALGAK